MSQVWFLLVLANLLISPAGLVSVRPKAENPHRLFNDTAWILHGGDNSYTTLSGDGYKPFNDDNDAFALCISVASLFMQWNYSANSSRLNQDKGRKRHLLHTCNAFLTFQGKFGFIKDTVHDRLSATLNDGLLPICKDFNALFKGNEFVKHEDIYNNNVFRTLHKGYAWMFDITRCNSQSVVVAPLNTLDSYVREVLDDATLFERMRYEWARYETFKSFPIHSPVMPSRLSKSGFFYTNVGDEVQCFSCKTKYNKWTEGDIVSDIHEKISPSCRHMMGIDLSNVPIHFDEGKQQSASVKPNEIRTNQGERFSNSTENSLFPARGTNADHKHPEFEDYDRRKESFLLHRNARYNDINAVVEAGFFYSGSRRCLTCFSCGAGVGNIDLSIIWNAHNLSCHYLQSKTQHGHMTIDDRQLEADHSSNQDPKNLGISTDLKNENIQQSRYRTSNHLNNNAVKENTTEQSKGEPNPVIQQLIEMGFEENSIKQSIPSIRDDDPNMETIIDKLLQINKEITDECRAKTKSRQTGKKANLQLSKGNHECHSNAGTKNVSEEYSQLIELLRCKVCMDENSEIVILPCGHFCTCANCTVKCRKCPICRNLIRQTIRVAR